MSKFGWLHQVANIAPLVLMLIPGIPPALVPHIIKGIQVAEQIEGASGEDKRKAAVAIVKEGAEGVNAVKPGAIDADAVVGAVEHGIATVIAVTNAANSVTITTKA